MLGRSDLARSRGRLGGGEFIREARRLGCFVLVFSEDRAGELPEAGATWTEEDRDVALGWVAIMAGSIYKPGIVLQDVYSKGLIAMAGRDPGYLGVSGGCAEGSGGVLRCAYDESKGELCGFRRGEGE